MTPRLRAALQAAVVLVAVGVLLAVALPRVAGTTLSAALGVARALTPVEVLGLLVLWVVGLWSHTIVATAALPRLRHRQALALNLSGSAAANLLPFGGPLGIGVGWTMARSWGFDAAPFGVFSVVVNLSHILVKLALPLAGSGVLLLTGTALPRGLADGTIGATVLLALVLGLLAAGLSSSRVADRVGQCLERLVSGVLVLLRRRPRALALRAHVLDARTSLLQVLHGGWHRMLLGWTAYVLLQAALLGAVLHLLGSDLRPSVVFAGFAVGRLLSLAPLTPGGVGIAESGTAAALVALGGAPEVVTAAVLVYAAITFALEIPVGGVVAGVWWWRRQVRVA